MAAAPGITAAQRVRVLFCIDTFEGPSRGGTEAQFWLLFQMLSRERFEPAIATLRASKFLTQQSAQVINLDVRSMSSPLSWWKLLRFAWHARADGYRVAHLFLNDVSVCLPPVLKLAGIQVIVARRDLGFWYTPGILKVLRFNARFVDKVIANARAVVDVVAASEGIPRDKMSVIFNGFSRGEVSGAAVAQKQRVPCVVLVANLRPLKRIEDLITAVSLLKQRGREVSCVVVGGDGTGRATNSYQGELQQLAADLGIAQQCTFVGRADNPTGYIQAADICVLCSETEGLSNAVIEYMFNGKPVVCTRTGGNVDLVRDGDNGYLVEVGDARGLADALGCLLADPVRAARMGDAGRQFAIQQFSPAQMVLQHEAIYAHLARQCVSVDQKGARGSA